MYICCSVYVGTFGPDGRVKFKQRGRSVVLYSNNNNNNSNIDLIIRFREHPPPTYVIYYTVQY